MNLLKTSIGRFRIIAFTEGLSYLLILFITMPLKYLFDTPLPNQIIGMAHGVLFMVYIFGAIQMHFLLNWKIKLTTLVLLASIIPFGTFYMDHKVFKNAYR